jgi:hypothetical protein
MAASASSWDLYTATMAFLLVMQTLLSGCMVVYFAERCGFCVVITPKARRPAAKQFNH